VGLADRRYRSTAAAVGAPQYGAQQHGVQQQMRAVSRCQPTQEAERGRVCCRLQRGFTPLHMAAKFGKLKVARVLLDRGADADAEGKYKLTPLHVATHYGNTDVALLLLDRHANPHCAAKVPLFLFFPQEKRLHYLYGLLFSYCYGSH